jgi:polysaccharide chain length determinant protein (PEP-CTERM system associated)
LNENPVKIKPEQIFEIILKRHWLLIIPFCLSMIVGIYLVIALPRVYESKTMILIQPQRVPTNIVRDIVESDINARITTLSQRILSRTNLESIIKEFDLFSGPESENIFLEDKVKRLEKMISVKVTQGSNRNADSFSITFRGTDPEKVMRVTSSLATSFIDENLKIRESQAIGTNTFLEDELETMRRRLIETEQKLKDYREMNMGGLPEQLDSNLRILDNLNVQLTAVQAEIRDAKLRLTSIEDTDLEVGGTTIGADGSGSQAPASLSQLREQLETYRSRYTDRHPDVVRLKKMVTELEIQLRTVDEGRDIASDTSSGDMPRFSATYLRQRRAINAEIERLDNEKKNLLAQIAVYKKRVEDTPKREQELQSLQRDYNNINQTYNSLLGRQLEAQIAVNMEKKQKGEQFRVLDPARIAQTPVSPDMKKLFVFVMAAGLGLGGGLIFLLEFLDTSFKEPEDIEAFLNLPVLATIPTVLNASETRRQKMRLIGSVFGVLLAVMLCAGFLGSIIMIG